MVGDAFIPSSTDRHSKEKKHSFKRLPLEKLYSHESFSKPSAKEKHKHLKYSKDTDPTSSGQQHVQSKVLRKKMSFKSPRKKAQSDSFSERLNEYTKIFMERDNVRYKDYVGQYYYLEESWNEVVTEHVYMPKKMKMQQQAIWEFLTTERNYIRKLRVVVEVFLQCFKIAQSRDELGDIKQNCIFANISEVLLANDEMWTTHLIKVINKARSSKQPIRPSNLLPPFSKLKELLRPYVDFCLQQDACFKYVRELTEPSDSKRNLNSKDFTEYLRWCENLPQCERFKLFDLMTEPMQRLTRYPLLIKNIKKETKDEKEADYLDALLLDFDGFISDINKTLRKRHEKEKLERCIEEFEYFNTMVASHEEVKWTAIDFLRMNVPNIPLEEQRCILKRGAMKIVDRHESTVEGFLFTDVFLLAKQRKSSSKYHVIRQMFYLDKIVLIKSEASHNAIVFVYLDEFGLLANTFLLEVPEGERDVWIKSIDRAKVKAFLEQITFIARLHDGPKHLLP